MFNVTYFEYYFSHMVTVCLIVRGNWNIQRKPPTSPRKLEYPEKTTKSPKQQTHIKLYRVELIMALKICLVPQKWRE